LPTDSYWSMAVGVILNDSKMLRIDSTTCMIVWF
jgi:hypothetical protein